MIRRATYVAAMDEAPAAIPVVPGDGDTEQVFSRPVLALAVEIGVLLLDRLQVLVAKVKG